MPEIMKLSTGATVQFLPARVVGMTCPAVLIVHGWKSKISSTSYTTVAEVLNNLGYHCLMVSLRGHENSDGDIGDVSRNDHLEDLREAVKYLQDLPGVEPGLISAVGSSYGAYLLAALSKEFNFRMLAMRAPALYPDGDFDEPTSALVASENLAQWRRRVHLPPESQALVGLQWHEGKILIVASGSDEDMPQEVAKSYLKAIQHSASPEYHEFIGAKHQLNEVEREQFLILLEAFFRRNYPGSSS